MNKLISIFTLGLAMAGCTTYSKRQCENFDWQALGQQSAIKGDLPNEKIPYYQRHCGVEHGIQPNVAQFNQGFESGLKHLCSPAGGKYLGESGFTYKGTCPPATEEPFLRKYESGRLEFLARRVKELEKEVDDLKYEVSRKDSSIDSLESEVSRLNSRSCND